MIKLIGYYAFVAAIAIVTVVIVQYFFAVLR